MEIKFKIYIFFYLIDRFFLKKIRPFQQDSGNIDQTSMWVGRDLKYKLYLIAEPHLNNQHSVPRTT